ncbi:MAG TPA: hypothetical protein VIL42_09900 [Sphingomicrobium sp.]|jgi:hypothetical protein
MKPILFGALALAAAAPVVAQTGPDLSYANPVAGNWRYGPTATGSEAAFVTAAGGPQLILRCTRATRRIAIIKPAPAAAPNLWVWTSLQARSVSATFDAATGRASAELTAFDGLFDAMASSRGRIGFSTPGTTPLVVPAWGEVARLVEDCRA